MWSLTFAALFEGLRSRVFHLNALWHINPTAETGGHFVEVKIVQYTLFAIRCSRWIGPNERGGQRATLSGVLNLDSVRVFSVVSDHLTIDKDTTERVLIVERKRIR